MRRTWSRHVRRSVSTGATTPNRNGLVMAGLRSRSRESVPGTEHRVAQVGDADARDGRRVAEEGGHAGEVVEEPYPGPEQDRREVDAEVVDEAGVEELPDGVGAVDADGLPARGGLRLLHGALEAVRHEVDRRTGPWPPVGHLVGEDESGPPAVVAAPPLRDLERAAPGEHGTQLGRQAA